MNITKKQTARILLAMSFAGFLGGVDQVFAEELPDTPILVEGTAEYSGTGDKTISSANKTDLPTAGGGNAIIQMKNNTQVTISGYDSLNVYNQTKGEKGYGNALYAVTGSSININNVKNIHVTNDTSTPTGKINTVALHAIGGTINIKDVDNLEIVAKNSGAIMAQQTGGSGAGKVDIDVNKDITISGGSVLSAIMGNAGNGKANESEVKIHAGGTASIDGNVGILNQWKKPDGSTADAVSGTSSLSILGDQGVDIKQQVYMNEKKSDSNNPGSGTYSINISSKNGAVTIDKGVSLKSAFENSKVSGSITGNTITLGNSDSTAIVADGASLTIGGDRAETKVNLNGSVTLTNSGEVNVGNGTTLYVDGSQLKDNTFLSADENSKLNLDNGSAIILKNWKDGNDFAKTGTDTGAYEGKVFVDNVFKSLDLATGKVEATTDTATLDKALEGVVAKNVIKEIAINNDKYANLATVLITDTGANKAASNAAVNLGELAGLNHSTYTASNLFTDTVGNHLSTLPQDKDLWGYYVHSKESVDGLGLAGAAANYDATYDGAVVGMDLYKNGNTAGGVAISYINGSLEGAGIKNDADYYGLCVYGRKDLASFSLVGDVSYLHGSNDITQNLAGKTITAKPDVDAFTVGVKALKDIALTESSKLTPYVGARYLRINTESYSSSLGLHYDADSQDLLLIPVGVDYSADFKHGAWTYRPTVGVGYVWNAAGRSVDETVSLENAADSFSYNTVDSSSFIAHVGVAAEKENISFGVGYEYQNGSSTSADKWYVNAAYRF